jgi:arylsulfatase A-like enzyme
MRFPLSPLLLATALLAPASPVPSRHPNLIVIVADDLGWGELGSYGQTVIQTPSLDRMAAEGLRFTHFYSGATVCAPSRSVLMTGQHQGRTRVRGNSSIPANLALRENDLTVARVLQNAGYVTGLFGKWGLGDVGPAESGLPRRQGFGTFFGFLNHYHAHNAFPDHLWRNEERLSLPNHATPVGRFGGSVTVDPILFADDLITDEILKWISHHQDKPFFAVWTPILPHANNEAMTQTGNGAQVPDFGPYATRDWPDQDKGHAAMVSRLDSYVGRLFDHLRRLGLDRETIVLFTSDNGPHQESGHNLARFSPAGPFSGTKRDLTDGGIRVPLIAWGPGRVQLGTTPHTAYFGDLMATAAELAGVSPPPGTDSISFVPTLLGNGAQPAHDFLYWEFNERGFQQAALWQGRWKAIRTTLPTPDFRLYDLQEDPAETRNLAASRQDLVARLTLFLDSARTATPEWPARPRQE